MKKISFVFLIHLIALNAVAQEVPKFNGLNMSLGNLSRISDAETRSIGPENSTGEKGKGGMADPVKNKGQLNAANAAAAAADLGIGWKVNPFVEVGAGKTYTLAEIDGAGAIQHIWMTPSYSWEKSVLRFYWDGEKEASVEVPLAAFFACGWNIPSMINSLAVTVNPGSGYNCYWQMPFRKHCRITIENRNPTEPMRLYYQVDYTLTTIAADQAYFHAQYRRSNPTMNSLHTLVDIRGKGQYVGTYMGIGVRNNGWWGEGEFKFYLDGDRNFATIVGTGTEDYFGGSYNFENQNTHQYQEFSTAYSGLSQVTKQDGLYRSQQRFGMYRWHIADPVRFNHDLKVTLQDLGWRANGKYLPQQSDIITVAYWYQLEPHLPFPKLPSEAALEIN